LDRISELEAENLDLTSQVVSRIEEMSELRVTLANTRKAEQALAALLTTAEQMQQATTYKSRVAELETTLALTKEELNNLSNRFADLDTAHRTSLSQKENVRIELVSHCSLLDTERGRAASLQQEFATIKEQHASDLASFQIEILSLRSSLSSAHFETDNSKLIHRLWKWHTKRSSRLMIQASHP
jgi:chromosome segregation ATPase